MQSFILKGSDFICLVDSIEGIFFYTNLFTEGLLLGLGSLLRGVSLLGRDTFIRCWAFWIGYDDTFVILSN